MSQPRHRARHTKTMLVVVALAIPAASVDPARAAPPAASVSKDKDKDRDQDEADRLFNEGNAAMRLGQWDRARAAYQASWNLRKNYDVIANLAAAEASMKRYRESAEHYALAIRTLDPQARDKALSLSKDLDQVRKHIATARVTVNVPGADILVDGVLMGQSPLGVDIHLDPGAHRVEARAHGYTSVTRPIQVFAGDTPSYVINLSSAVAGAAPPQKDDAKAPHAMPVDASDPARDPDATETKRRPMWPVYAGAAATGVALLSSLVFWGVAKASAGAAEDHNRNILALSSGQPSSCSTPAPNLMSDCNGILDDYKAKDAYQNAATVGLITGGALAAATAIYYTLALTPTPNRAMVVPTVARSSGGLLVTGHF